ncbi:hypothetical protein AGMMS49546_15140 [Spirochaetia bacterium]|nr:hypothetical protein AGMMS49546_15140 [Spirochaetia bacterium]
MGWCVDLSLSPSTGLMTITFPGRPQGSSNLSNISSFRIPQATLEMVFSGNTSGNVGLLINSSGNTGEKKISVADVNTITAAINDGLAGVVKRYKETFKDGVSQGSVIDGDGSVSAEPRDPWPYYRVEDGYS